LRKIEEKEENRLFVANLLLWESKDASHLFLFRERG
jgi:hypothetical protein